jgi:hypothetical protein
LRRAASAGFVEDLPTNSVYSKGRSWKGGRVV